MEICKREYCTGCGMCVNLCPKNAIEMQKDDRGFYYPKVDCEKCISCSLCQKKCPINSKDKDKVDEPTVYAAWNKNRNQRRRSSSGGVFSLLAEKMIKDNGVVVGVKWDEELCARHCCIENIEDVKLLNGSKYVQSVTGNIYREIKNYLEQGRKVLFSGTPCQVHALKLYLGKSYKDLQLVDFVCHGVPSKDILDRHINEISDNAPEKVKSIQLRHKDPCWSYSSVKVDFEDRGTYKKLTVEDAYFNLFNFNYSLRESCHVCQYTSVRRESDITLCDFWGYIPNGPKMMDYDKGVSCVLVNSDKGKQMFHAIKKYLKYQTSSIEQAKSGNQCLSKPFERPVNLEQFWDDYKEGMSVEALDKKYIKQRYQPPNLYALRRLKNQLRWIKRNK